MAKRLVDNLTLVRIEHADGAQLSRCASKAASSTNDIDSVAIVCDCVNASESTDLKRVRCGILQKYGVASRSHPMMVHLCGCETAAANAPGFRKSDSLLAVIERYLGPANTMQIAKQLYTSRRNKTTVH